MSRKLKRKLFFVPIFLSLDPYPHGGCLRTHITINTVGGSRWLVSWLDGWVGVDPTIAAPALSPVLWPPTWRPSSRRGFRSVSKLCILPLGHPFCKSVAGTWYLPGMSFHESIVLSIRRVFVRIRVSDFVKVNLLKVFLEFFKIISPLPNSFLRFYC